MLAGREIIEGAFYAMEQAGLLINDAASLYNQRKWPSSLVLAVFAMEELGKAEVLLQRGIDAASTGDKTRAQVMAGQTSHPTKLKAGQGTATVTTAVSFGGNIPAPGTTEAQTLEQRLNAAEQVALQHAPGAEHEARMCALYVDLTDTEIWSRPKETTAREAYLMVSGAGIEYGVRREKFVHPTNTAVQNAVTQLGAQLPILPTAPDIHWPTV